MKKSILLTLTSFTLLHVATYGQQASGTSPAARVDAKTFDAAKLTEKEISMEVNAGKSDVFLDNNYRTIEIKTWNQPKVKVSTKVYLDGKSTLTDEQWFDKLNLGVKQAGGMVQITSRNISSNITYYSTTTSSNSLVVFDGGGKNLGTIPNAKRAVTILIPEGSKLEVENQYGKLQLSSNMQAVNIKSTNGSIEAADVNRLIVRSKYTPMVIGNVKDAEIELTNGRLKAGNIDKLDIDSKYSTVEIASVNDAMLRSTNDEYEIEDAGDVKGRKSYGNFRISNLKTGIDILGANADIKIRNLSPTVETINIDNKYADIRLPVNKIKNYAVKFNGKYNTVYAPFEKKPLTDTASKKVNVASNSSGGTRIYTGTYVNGQTAISFADAADSNGFTAQAGDVKGKHTKFLINCASCTVDFK